MNKQHRDILVAYDGSPDADEALLWAAATAVAEHRSVRAVMVIDRDVIPAAALPVVESTWQEFRDRTEMTLKEAGVNDAQAEIVGGPVVPTLLRAAESASMVVTGSRGHGHLANVLAGGVSSHLARHARCPVVVVRPPERPDAARIVVGLDGSADSQAALEFACQRAELTGDVVVAIHGWSLNILPIDKVGSLPSHIGEEMGDKEVLLAESVAGVRASHPDVVVLQEPIPVRPGQALVDASSTASLVVTGSRGHGHFVGLLLGSVSNEVLHRAHCPVAIVR
jgi:nucleotide-binding universal stress UspA family protein